MAFNHEVVGSSPTEGTMNNRVDAKDPLTIVVCEDDIIIASNNKGDEENCVFACAAKRMYGSDRVQFKHHIAYIESLDSKGNPIFVRYHLGVAAKKAVEVFDTTGRFEPGRYVLLPPPSTQTLPAMRVTAKKQQAKIKKEIESGERKAKAVERAEVIRKQGGFPGTRKGGLTFDKVRSGEGTRPWH